MSNKKKTIDLNDKTILEIFKKKNNYNFDEIAKLLKVSGSTKAKLKAFLDRLIKDGIVYYDEKDKVYTLLENSHLIKGVIEFKNNRYCVDNKSKILFINDEFLNGATVGDEVIITYDFRVNSYVVKRIIKCDDKTYLGEIKFEYGRCYVVNDELGKLEVDNDLDVVDGNIVSFKKLYGNIIIEDVICHKNEANADIMRIVYNHNFIAKISDKMNNELSKFSNFISLDDNNLRYYDIEDLRDVNFITIDCDDTKDMDDAVNVRVLDNGDMVLTTAISLVPYYVNDGSSLSGRIRREGTSIYPAGCVIPMLPPKLSNGICSLNEMVDRLALVIETTFDEYGNYLGVRPYLGIINSKKKCKYSEVNKILEDGIMVSGYEPFYKDLLLMQKLALLLECNFKDNGFVEFDVNELKINVDEDYKLDSINVQKQMTAEKIIEYFMLISNNKLAEYLTDLGLNIIYRVDGEPDKDNVYRPISFLKDKEIINIDINRELNQFDFQNIILDLRKIDNEVEREIYNRLLIRTLPKAYYSAYNIGHFPLGVDYYAQFTSPIRRGPDWRNIMILLYYFKTGSVEETNKRYPKEMLEEEAKRYSERERAAVEVESECNSLIISNFIEDNLEDIVGVSYVGYISGISKNYMYVTLENGIVGKVSFSLLGNKVKEITEYTIRTTTNNYHIGDRIDINIKGVDKKYNEICFELQGVKKNKVRSRKV